MITSRVREYRSPQLTIQVERRRDRRARRRRVTGRTGRTEAAQIRHEEIRHGW